MRRAYREKPSPKQLLEAMAIQAILRHGSPELAIVAVEASPIGLGDTKDRLIKCLKEIQAKRDRLKDGEKE